MPTAIITESGGRIGSESVAHFVEGGCDIGLENDVRARFFGSEASTQHVSSRLVEQYAEFRSLEIDIRDNSAVLKVFADNDVGLVVDTAAQPSHAAFDPQTDFGVNANGTTASSLGAAHNRTSWQHEEDA